ncbi:MAG: carboxylesterase family protein [Actinobacteria bacterium]|nr:carboxylesterase family protein [Actinomycetota bacterium]
MLVTTSSGRLQGCRDKNVHAFFAIPYAAPPTGQQRWRPPLPTERWRGIRKADQPGAIAPQLLPNPGAILPGDPTEMSEDSLSLNIWTPSLDDGKRPVMVWVHGGGFSSGSGSSQIYNGALLAELHNVVVVTINYRLGILGFLAHPNLYEASHRSMGNWGLLDQMSALKWVRKNIASFGGDPNNITVFGESAGGMGISALLNYSVEEIDADHAIVQSGPPIVQPLKEATKVAEQVASSLGLSSVDRTSLSKVPISELLEVQASLNNVSLAERINPLGLTFMPVADAGLLDDTLMQSLPRRRKKQPIALLAGSNLDEAKLFALSEPQLQNLTHESLKEILTASLRLRKTVLGLPEPSLISHKPSVNKLKSPDNEEAADALLDGYAEARRRRGQSTEPFELWAAIASDWIFRVPTIAMVARHVKSGGTAFAYLFTWQSPILGDRLGSCHALEVPFVFSTFDVALIRSLVGSDPDTIELSTRIQDAWSSFASHGTPSSSKLPKWDPYTVEEGTTMVLDRECKLLSAPFDEEVRLWEIDSLGDVAQ